MDGLNFLLVLLVSAFTVIVVKPEYVEPHVPQVKMLYPYIGRKVDPDPATLAQSATPAAPAPSNPPAAQAVPPTQTAQNFQGDLDTAAPVAPARAPAGSALKRVSMPAKGATPLVIPSRRKSRR